jgi:hypothetical protein
MDERAPPTSLSDWGVYIAGVGAVLIWVLKALADKSKTEQRTLHRSRDAMLTRALWSFAPPQPGIHSQKYSTSVV